jgi:hypothetical protein
MLDFAISLLPGVPYLAGILIFGTAGNMLFDRQVKLSSHSYIALSLLVVTSLVATCYCVDHGPRAALMLWHGVFGASFAFLITVSGLFAVTKAQAVLAHSTARK